MKNWEFYEEQLKEHSLAFALVNNQIRWCSETSCSECAFGPKCSLSCNEVKIKWLYQEHKEPVVLTDDEKALCKLLGRGWIARDKNGDLYWYENKTEDKVDEHWCIPINTTIMAISKIFPQCKFDFIKWEDEEPWEVKVDD